MSDPSNGVLPTPAALLPTPPVTPSSPGGAGSKRTTGQRSGDGLLDPPPKRPRGVLASPAGFGGAPPTRGKKKKGKASSFNDARITTEKLKATYTAIMGVEPLPNLMVRLKAGAQLKPKDVQAFMLWALGIGSVPDWATLRLPHLIPGVVCLMINSLGSAAYHETSAMPLLKSKLTMAVPTRTPGRDYIVYNFMQALLMNTLSKTKTSIDKNADKSEEFPIDHYLLSTDALQDHEYPGVSLLEEEGDPEANMAPWRQSQPRPDGVVVEAGNHVLAVDCEMCLTCQGNELTRVTVVNFDGKVLMDELVVPKNPILDYKTKYSGITAAMLEGVTTTLENIQDSLLGSHVLTSETVLVGHSLENDLRALRIVHGRVVDTATIFSHSSGGRAKPGLSWLAYKYLSRRIQHLESGHNSSVDAKATLDLFKLKLKQGPEFGVSNAEVIFEKLARSNIPSAMVDRSSLVRRYVTGNASGVAASDDEEVTNEVIKLLRGGDTRFIFAQLHDLESNYARQAEEADRLAAIAAGEDDSDADASDDGEDGEDGEDKTEAKAPVPTDEVLSSIDQHFGRIYDALPPHTMVVVVTAHGDQSAVKRLRARQREEGNAFVDINLLKEAVDTARNSLTMVGFKRPSDPPAVPASGDADVADMDAAATAEDGDGGDGSSSSSSS